MGASGAVSSCVFCTQVLSGADRPLREGVLVVAFADAFPSAPGHTLVVPRRHVARLLDLTVEEHAELFSLARSELARLEVEYGPDAFTLGVNDGAAAGQTVPHVHLHLIPRHVGDVPIARGGVRWVIPGTAAYWAPR